MPRKKSAYLSIMLVTAFMGLLLAVQFRAANTVPDGITSDRAKELLAELKQVNNDREILSKEIGDLTYKLNQLNKGRTEAINALSSELEKLRIVAGLVTVTGTGIEVVLDNPQNGGKITPEVSFIQDQDLLGLVNELWGAGAEAISINGQRIISTTEIRLAAPFININTIRVVPPYQVLAIGNPDTMANALELPGGLIEYYRDMGFQATVEKHDDLTIPGYTAR